MSQWPVNSSVARVTKTGMNGHHDRVKFDKYRSYFTGSKRADRVTVSATPNTDHYTDSLISFHLAIQVISSKSCTAVKNRTLNCAVFGREKKYTYS